MFIDDFQVSEGNVMDTSSHTIETLFRQLGLPDRPDEIQAFVAEHKAERRDTPLCELPFWSSSQAEFLRMAVAEDADWCEVVDQLDALLRG
jgi:hypothetical protein